MRLLLDQGMPMDATPILRSLGYQCIHVAELGLHQAEDEDIVALAVETSAVVITLTLIFMLS